MYFDGSFSLKGAGARALLIFPASDELHYVVQLLFDDGSNNMPEYKGLLTRLRAAAALGIRHLVVRGDS